MFNPHGFAKAGGEADAPLGPLRADFETEGAPLTARFLRARTNWTPAVSGARGFLQSRADIIAYGSGVAHRRPTKRLEGSLE